jgi:hypothetical protein
VASFKSTPKADTPIARPTCHFNAPDPRTSGLRPGCDHQPNFAWPSGTDSIQTAVGEPICAVGHTTTIRLGAGEDTMME